MMANKETHIDEVISDINLFEYVTNALHREIKKEINKTIKIDDFDYKVDYIVNHQEYILSNQHNCLENLNVKYLSLNNPIMVFTFGNIEIIITNVYRQNYSVSIKLSSGLGQLGSTATLTTPEEFIAKIMDLINIAVPDYTLEKYGIIVRTKINSIPLINSRNHN